MSTIKNYYAYKIEGSSVPDWYGKERMWFVCEKDRKDLWIRIDEVEWGLNELLANRQSLFYDNDISALRFLPNGISVVRRNKFINTHESNQWVHVVLPKLDGYDASRVSVYDDDDMFEDIENAFLKSGVVVKAGKFAKSLGCTDAEAEAFSREYNRHYGECVADSYTFELVDGDDIVSGYNSDNYAYRNSSPLWGSCMNGRDYVKWYAKNKGAVKLAILRSNGYIVCRSIVWVDTEIRRWGKSSYGCSDGSLVYSGMFADRQYYYDDRSLEAIRIHFQRQGIAHKVSTSFGDGALSVPVDGVFTPFESGEMLMTCKIKFVSGKYPYIDTLHWISSKKIASNRAVEGVIKRCVSTQGSHEKHGEFVRVELGLPQDDLKFSIRQINNARLLVLPDGKEVYAYGGDAIRKIGATEGIGDNWGKHFILSQLGIGSKIKIPKYNRGTLTKQTIEVCVYSHQMDMDFATGELKVARLYDEKSKTYKPIDEFVIMNVSRSRWSTRFEFSHKPKLAREYHKLFAIESTQVDQ